MTTLPFPLDGRVLVVGPSQAGKTTVTAAALEAWLATRGPAGVVVLDYAPEFEADGRVLGGRIDRYATVPDDVWYGVLDAHAPRARAAGDVEEAVRLAGDNASRAKALFRMAPSSPRAVFVNDATIPFQHESGDPERLLAYCDEADVTVLNALESDELGIDDPVSRCERRALAAFRRWATRVVRLSRGADETVG